MRLSRYLLHILLALELRRDAGPSAVAAGARHLSPAHPARAAAVNSPRPARGSPRPGERPWLSLGSLLLGLGLALLGLALAPLLLPYLLLNWWLDCWQAAYAAWRVEQVTAQAAGAVPTPEVQP